MHGVAGSSASAKAAQSGRTRGRGRSASAATTSGRTRGASNGTANAVNRDALLAAVFPNGVPPRESVIRELSAWLDQAEKLARQR
jgi:hypothetical protein